VDERWRRGDDTPLGAAPLTAQSIGSATAIVLFWSRSAATAVLRRSVFDASEGQ